LVTAVIVVYVTMCDESMCPVSVLYVVIYVNSYHSCIALRNRLVDAYVFWLPITYALLVICSAKVMEEKLRYAAYNCLAIDMDTSPICYTDD